jgi:MoxR-like ATPase
MCRLAVGYQDEAAEREIVRRVATPDGPPFATEFVAQLRTDAVALTRATRAHPAIRHGSSVRGAIDLALVTGELIAMRGITGTGGEGRAGAEPGYDADAPLRHRYATTVYDAMVVSLSGRIHPDETAESTPEQLLREIWADYYLLDRAVAGPG